MRKRLTRLVLATAFITALVFTLAGTWRNPWLWAYIGTWTLTLSYGMFSMDEDLAKERFHPPTRSADRVALAIVRIVAVSHIVLGALDVGRWHLTAPIPGVVRAVALAAMPIAFGMFFRAMRENRFFSAVVRVQDDRGHRVIDSGPYGVVRHPGYAGLILGTPFSGLALGSWLAVALGVVMSALILRRVLFEDAFLRQHLDGYVAYARRVPQRLIPGVW